MTTDQTAVNQPDHQVSSDGEQLPTPNTLGNEHNQDNSHVPANDGNTNESPPNSDQDHPESIPYDRFKQVIEERNKLREQLEQASNNQDDLMYPFQPYIEQPQPAQTQPENKVYTEKEIEQMVENGEMTMIQGMSILNKQMLEERERIQEQKAMQYSIANRTVQFAQSHPEIQDPNSQLHQTFMNIVASNPAVYLDNNQQINWQNALPLAESLANSIKQPTNPTANINATYEQNRQANLQSAQMNMTTPASNNTTNNKLSAEQIAYAKNLGVDLTK